MTDTISQTRTHLLLDSPWFGSLAMRLQLEATEACKTMRTDGTRLQYNPTYVENLSGDVRKTMLAHEVLHCALAHPYRIAGRDLKEWNEACDFAINQILVEAGFTLWDGALIDPQYAGMGADQIFALRHREKQEQSKTQPDPQQPQGSQGNGAGDDSSQQGDADGDQPGEVTAPQPGDEQGDAAAQPEQMSEADWQIAAEQATAVAKKAGRMPGGADRAVKASRESETNWREILRRFVEQTVPSDYSWTHPNRRYIAAGLYLPGTVRENMPRLKVAVDTSGSITDEMLQIFSAELTQILHEARPEAVDVYYCDTRVQHVESFSPDDPEIKLQAHGGGGTEFQPVFDRIAEEGDEPAALIYFTDLEGPAPKDPGYPVLWITSECTSGDGFFGDTVRLSEWK